MTGTLYSSLDGFLLNATTEHAEPVFENLPWLFGAEKFRFMTYLLENRDMLAQKEFELGLKDCKEIFDEIKSGTLGVPIELYYLHLRDGRRGLKYLTGDAAIGFPSSPKSMKIPAPIFYIETIAEIYNVYHKERIASFQGNWQGVINKFVEMLGGQDEDYQHQANWIQEISQQSNFDNPSYYLSRKNKAEVQSVLTEIAKKGISSLTKILENPSIITKEKPYVFIGNGPGQLVMWWDGEKMIIDGYMSFNGTSCLPWLETLEKEAFHRPNLMYNIQEDFDPSDVKLLFVKDFSWVPYVPLTGEEVFGLAEKCGIAYDSETMETFFNKPEFSSFNFDMSLFDNLSLAYEGFLPFDEGFPAHSSAFDHFFSFFGIADTYQDWLDANPDYKANIQPRDLDKEPVETD